MSRNRLLLMGVFVVLAAAAGVGAYFAWFHERLPRPGSPEYVEYVRTFQVGVAALDSGVRPEVALPKLNRAVELIPAEPAGWANRGLFHLRQNNLPEAKKDLETAARRAPESAEIAALLGVLEERQGHLPEAISYLRKALDKKPHDVSLLFLLARAIAKEGGPDSDAQYQQLLEKILAEQPNNLHILMERAEVAYRRKDQAAVRDTLDRLGRLAPNWKKDGSRDPHDKLAEVRAAVEKGSRDTEFLLIQLGHLMRGERGYVRGMAALRAPEDAVVGQPLQYFLRLEQPRPTPAPPDRGLAFAVGPWPRAKGPAASAASRWDALSVLWRIDEAKRDTLVQVTLNGGLSDPAGQVYQATALAANAGGVHRADAEDTTMAYPSGATSVAPSPFGVVVLDWNNDLRQDVVLAGAGGVRFWRQQADGSFTDVTKKTGLPADVLDSDYYGGWAADVEMDGDLDVVLARRSGTPLVLRNNGDGTFKMIEVKAFAGVRDVRAFVWADLDNDGAPDAIFLDGAGMLHVFFNERFVQFTASDLPKGLGSFVAVTAADVNDDGVFDIVAARADGSVMRISDQDHRASWQSAELARGPALADAAVGTVLLFTEDLDNNGAIDFVVAGPTNAQVFLADEAFQFQALPAPIALRVFAVVDLDNDGRLDLLGLSAAGKLEQARNTGTKSYRAQVLRPVANARAEGDNRNNSFAVGGEIEVRSGLLVQKQRITGPSVHFGVAEEEQLAVVRVVWPNGNPQWEFEVPRILLLAAGQRLAGSCPFLFAYDGTGMRFAGDTLWNTPLGMFINGQPIDSFGQTTEWLKVRGEDLKARDGVYDLRVQANLWETDYFDQAALLVVDHPPDTEVYVDERFFLTPTPPKLYVTTPARPVARAWDHHGVDATDVVKAIDGLYLDRAGRGKYQGITADHWVEADLGDDAPADGPLYLIARGWIHPTDSSINAAIAQGQHDQPQPLVLEVPDGKGGWKVGRPALGFPAGRNKTMLIRLDGADGPGVSRRFRLRTNLEIYWDFLGYASGLDAALARVQRPAPRSAELRYRGILETTQKDPSSPEMPHYDKVMRGRQLWRDLEGNYTRYGDVRELLARADDRYVIMNAGDEIAFEFPAPTHPPTGWRRDFIFECDGWTRDGNFNTRFGTTVLPLPAHGLKRLDQPPGRLQDDPVYQRFPQDWQNYHTRYVTADDFARGLRPWPGRRPSPGRGD